MIRVYHLDYQERPLPRADARWVDRLTLDGSWSGNLFDFYRRTYRKLVSDLKIPFVLENGQRQDETPVHEALREALVNTIVHADYAGRAAVMVVKRPDMFGFRNPGLMRIPVAQAIAGGESDGRNRTLQSLFLLIGAGERAGSGVPKIHKGWKDQHWRPPALYEREEPSDQTLLELHMINLIPAEAMDRLRDQFGTRLDGLNPDQRLILATAATEHQVTHPRIMSLCDLHPTDLSRLFALLVQDGFLEQSGRTRATVYRLPGSEPPRFQQEFGSSGLIFDDRRRPGKGSDLLSKGSEWPPESMDLNSEPLAQGRRSNAAQGDPLAELTHKEQKQLESIADLVRAHHKVAPETIKTVILALCMNRYLTIRTLARLLDRNETYLRQRILNPLVRSHLLTRAYPLAPNDPRQAYCTSKINPDDL